MNKNFKFVATLLILIVFPLVLQAQWSNDPSQNTVVRDTIGYLIVPHVAANPAGDSYISWYSATEGLRFDVYLQHFDINGNKLWADDGLLVSDHQTDTWVSDYGLVVDHQGYAILTVQDWRDGHSNAFAYRISPDGVMQWGPDGIRLTNTTDGNYWPQVTVTGDNDFIFLYQMFPEDTALFSHIGFQKVDQGGNMVWTNTIASDSSDFFLPQMLLTEDGNLIVSWLAAKNSIDTVYGHENYIHVFVQKFSPDGQALWPAPVQVDTGDVMIVGALYTLPLLANDGTDGAYMVWQSFSSHEPTVFANHIGGDGLLLWPGHGTPVSMRPWHHTEPSICFIDDINRLFVFWKDYRFDPDYLTDSWAISGQKFSPSGARLWGDTAIFIAPIIISIDTAYINLVIKTTQDNDIGLFYEKGYLDINGADTSIVTELYACLLDTNAAFVWPGVRRVLSDAVSEKVHLTISNLVNTQWIAAWDDNRQDPHQEMLTGIYAQNITGDGDLGPLAIEEQPIADRDGLRCFPNPFCDRITVNYDLHRKGKTTLTLRDVRGRILGTVNAGLQESGRHTLNLDFHALTAGIYIIEFRTGDRVRYARIVKK
jgi:hypothetical protein